MFSLIRYARRTAGAVTKGHIVLMLSVTPLYTIHNYNIDRKKITVSKVHLGQIII